MILWLCSEFIRFLASPQHCCINNVKLSKILHRSVFVLLKTSSTSAGICYKTVSISQGDFGRHTLTLTYCTYTFTTSRQSSLSLSFNNMLVCCFSSVSHLSWVSLSIWLLVILLVLWYCFMFVSPWRKAEQGRKEVFPMTYASTTTNHATTCRNNESINWIRHTFIPN